MKKKMTWKKMPKPSISWEEMDTIIHDIKGLATIVVGLATRTESAKKRLAKISDQLENIILKPIKKEMPCKKKTG